MFNRFNLFTRRLRLPLAAAAAAAAVAGVLGMAATASAAQAGTAYTKNGNYQFASNYTDGSAYPFVVSDSPLGYTTANESLGASGVNLTTAGSPNYASAAVIVPLGKLSSLFDASGAYVPPAVDGSGNLLFNLYFDTNGNGTYFGWNPADDPYALGSLDGDTAASMDSGITTDQADFTTFSGDAGYSSLGGALSGQMTMEQVKAAFAARTDGGANDPEVWAWIGVQTTASSDPAGYVTSVDGTPLVTAPPPSQYVALTKLPPLVLDDPSGSTANGTSAQVWSSKTGVKGNEQFTVVSHGSYDTIALARDTRLCLDVRNGGVTNGTKVQFWACNGGKDQEWKPTVDGYLEAVYATVADNVTMVLDDPSKGGSGTRLQIWADNGGPQQFWTVPPVS